MSEDANVTSDIEVLKAVRSLGRFCGACSRRLTGLTIDTPR